MEPYYIPLFNSTSLSRTNILNPSLIIEKAKSDGLEAVGISEYMNFFSMIDFSNLALKNKVKPVFSVILNSFWEDEWFGEVIVFIKNSEGFNNISKLMSKACIEKDFFNGNIYLKLEEILNCTGIILVLAKNNKFQESLQKNNLHYCEDILKKIKESLIDNFYLALDLIEDPFSYNEKKTTLADLLYIPLVYYHKPLFATNEDGEPYHIFDCVLNKKQYDEDVLQSLIGGRNSFLNKEIVKIKSIVKEALDNTYYIAVRCNFLPKKHGPIAPSFLPDPKEEERLFRELAKKGLEELLVEIDPKDPQIYWNRLAMELDVITSKNFAGYFLIVADFMKWSKENGIPVGPGRGSGAGSIVAWSLGITALDPIEFELIFERFLNPERVAMPDFDIDFSPAKREEVLKYVNSKYGNYNCAHIITFGLMKAKMVVRDVGRVLGFSYYDVDRIAKIIPIDQIRPVKLSEVLQNDERLKSLYDNDTRTKKLIDISLKLEGLPRTISVHAAGYVISNHALYSYAPLYLDHEGGQMCIQLNMHQVEEVGLIKFDFLCLSTLDIWANIVSLVEKTRNIKLSFDTRKFDDEETYEIISTGMCNGIFQLESAGIQDIVVQMKPSNIEEVNALISLFRPGPIAQIPHYIRRKNGEELVDYLDPILEPFLQPILQKTYGIIVYQEQVMEITRKVASYSLGKADIVRKAMGKKKPEEMMKQEQDFISGAQKNGVPQSLAKRLFDYLSTFAGYAFNRPHAACYGCITYNLAGAKAKYMAEFYCTVLNNDIHDSLQILNFITEMRRFHGFIESPDINRSENLFSVVNDKTILYGLEAIRGVGHYGQKIMEERMENGCYKSFQDFLNRNKSINKKVIRALIYSGAFDSLDINRCKLITISEVFLETKFVSEGNIGDLDKKQWSTHKTVANEHEAFGFFLNRTTLDIYKQLFAEKNIYNLKELYHSLDENDTSIMTCAAILEEIKKRKTAKGIPYAFISVMDGTASCQMTVFSKLLADKYDIFTKNNLLILKIQGRKESGTYKFSVREAEDIESFLSRINYSILIKRDNYSKTWEELVEKLSTSLQQDEKKKKNVSLIFGGRFTNYSLDKFIHHYPELIQNLDELGFDYEYVV